MLGGGWYTGSLTHMGKTNGPFGFPKVCYKIQLGEKVHYSTTSAKYSRYFVEKSEHNAGEIYNFESCGMEITEENYDDSAWENAIPARPLGTELYEFSDCPTDKLIREIKPTVNAAGVYDASLNLTGFPVLISGGGDVEVVVSEEINPDGTLDEAHVHHQYLVFKNTKKGQLLEPLFTCLGFRYFKIIGDAQVECVKQIHADVKVTSTFDTGIFGTEIVTRLLFKYGRGDIAVKLLCASESYGFGAWKKQGATTLWSKRTRRTVAFL